MRVEAEAVYHVTPRQSRGISISLGSTVEYCQTDLTADNDKAAKRDEFKGVNDRALQLRCKRSAGHTSQN